MKKPVIVLSFLLSALLLLCTGCGKDAGEGNGGENMSLRVGLMPAADSAPFLLAEKRGYFKEKGIDVTLEVYNNAVDRQSALQSGRLDGTMTDLIAFVNNVQNGFKMKITTSTDGSFPFLVRKGFQETDTIRIGMMEISVSNFLSDRYLGDKYKLEKVFIDEIPARLEMIKAGKVDMASLPEPVASMGQLSGLEKRVYENKDEFMPEAMVFTEEALRKKEKAIALFHEAFNNAVEDIQKDEGLARDILIEGLKLDPKVRDLMILPQYHKTRLPDEEYMQEVVDWIEKVQGIKITVKYENMVERKFINP